MNFIPRFEKLEDRILLDAEPTVTVDGPDSVNLGDQNVAYTLTFDNTSGDATPGDPNDGDAGFKPFVDVVLPQGADGDDGITFDNATFLGTTLTPVELEFGPGGTVEHPFAIDTNGDPILVTGNPGDTLLVFQLPYGSFAPNQAPVDIILTVDYSNLADLDEPLPIQARGGFESGNTPDDDEATDPTILGAFDSLVSEQKIFNLEKFNSATEEETATGPNFPLTYTLALDVATGQQLDNILIEDFLPNNIVYLGNLTVTGVDASLVSVVEEPALNVASNGSRLAVSVAGESAADFLTGVAGDDVIVTFDYFINDVDANGDPVINAASGDDAPILNTSQATADWTPIDPRDDPTALIDDDQSTTNLLAAKSLNVQKSGVLVDDPDGLGAGPGDTFEFTLEVQISDFFTMGNVVLTDTLGDGYELDTSFQPTFIVSENGVTTADDQSFVNVFDPVSGESTVTFDLSAALLAAGAADGVLVGDLARDAVQTSGTTATIVYRATVKDEFVNPNGDAAISQGDDLENNVTVSADVLDNVTGVVTDTETDDSSFSVSIPFGAIESKTVVAINGSAPDGSPVISAGDAVTFSVIYNAPLGAFESLVVDDFMPIPVFVSTEVTNFLATPPSATPPPVGSASFGAVSQLYFDEGGLVPTVATNAGSNSLSFDFGTFTSSTPQVVRIEVLFTVTVQDVIFGDGLLLTNQATGIEANTDGTSTDSTAIVNFEYTEPEMTITKGIVALNSPDGSFTAPVGPAGVSFAAPGTAGAAFTGTINSDGIATTPIDANAVDLDAGDVVTFAVVLENSGGAPAGAFDVRILDTLPEGFEAPPGGLNIKATLGDGTVVPFTLLGGGLFDPAGGLELNDTVGQGAVGAVDPTSGANIVLITYDLVVSQDAEPSDVMTNVATLTQFAAFDNGIDRLPVDLTDDATVETLDPSVEKTLLSTEFPDSESAGTGVLIGEEIVYRIVIEVPEGTIDNLTLEDRTQQLGNDAVPGTLEILSGEIVGFGSNLTFNGLNQSENGLMLGSMATLVDNQLGDGINDGFTFDFGDIVNLADNDGQPGNTDAADQIVIEVRARANPDATTQLGDILTNEAVMEYQVTDQDGDPRTERLVNSQDIRVLEPDVDIVKSADPTEADGSDVISYQLVVTAAGGQFNSAAYDLVITDILDDPDLFLNPGSVVLSGAGAVNAVVTTGNVAGDSGIRVDVSKLDAGDVLIIDYTGTVTATPEFGDILPNTANLTYDSLPTDDDPFERDYSDSDDAQVLVSSPDITKTIVNTSFDETPETPDVELNIGEEVTFEIVATLREGLAPITITDLLPSTPGILDYVSSEIVFIGGQIQGSLLNVGDEGTVSGQSVAFDFGTLVNVVDNTLNADDTIVIRVVAKVSDAASTGDGDVLTNSATLDFGNGTVSDTAEATVTEPVLTLDKALSPATGDAGDQLTYTLTVAHDGTSTGPAYDVVVEDTLLNALLGLEAGSVTAQIDGTNVPIAQIVTGNGAADDQVRIEVPVLETGEILQVTFTVILGQDANFNATIDNRATVDFDSSPLDDPAEGRTGEQLEDTERFTTDQPTLLKEVVASDFDETVGNDVGIGETITYNLRITVPQGTSNVSLLDSLPAGLTFISSEVLSIDSDLTIGSGLSVGDAGSHAAGNTTFDFGLVVSDATLDPGDDEILVQVVARVDPTGPAAQGDALTNNATLTFDNGTVDASATVDVVLPVLNIEKSVSPLIADGGDTVSYTVEITHDAASDGPAYDLIIADATFLTEAALDFDGGSVVVEIDGGAAVDAVIDLGNDPADTELRVLIPVLNVGETLTVTFTATVTDDAPFDSAIVNTATTDYDTSPSDDPADGRNQAQIADDATFDTPAPTIDKALADPADATLVVGETIEYRLTIVIPDGTGEIVVIDDLPTPGNSGGLISFVSGEIISVGAGITGSSLAVGAAPSSTADLFGADGLIDQATFDFGSLTIIDDGLNADYNTIVIEVVGLVEDVAANVRGDVFTNTATLEYETRNGTQSVSDTQDATLTEPKLILDKEGSALAVNPDDTITYTLTLTHDAASDAPGQDITINDLLTNAFLDLDVGTVTAVVNGGGASGTPVINTGNTGGDTGINVTLDTLDVGDVLVIEYSVTLNAAAPEAQSFINEADAEYDSLAGPGGREDTADDLFRVATVPALFKSVENTEFAETGTGQGDPLLTDLAVGEEISFLYELFFPEALSENVIFADQLPTAGGSLTILNAEVINVGANLAINGPGAGGGASIVTDAGAGTVSIDFGEVDNTSNIDLVVDAGDRIQIRVTAVATGADAANAAGAALTNAATLNLDVGGTSLSAEDAVTVEVVEPDLNITKSVSPANADAGDTLTYTLTVTHDGASSGPAYDVVVADPLLATLNLNAGTVTTTIGTVTTGNTGGDSDVRIDIPVLNVGQSATITFQVTLGDNALFNSTQTNTASLDYDSDPEENGDERQYVQETATSDVTTPEPTITKSVLETSIDETPDGPVPSLTVGETVTYEIVVDLVEGTSPLTVVDALPAGLEYVTSEVTAFNGTIVTTGLNLNGEGNNAGANTIFDFGTITVSGTPGDGNPSITILLTAVVVDAGGPLDGDALQNTATLNYNGGADADTADVTIVEPELEISKSGPPAANPGDVGDYELRVTHTSDSTAAAFDVVIEDTVANPNLILDTLSVEARLNGVLVPVTIINTGGQDGFRVELDTILLGQELVITYQAQLAPTAPLASTFINTATLDWDSVGEDDEIAGNPGRAGSDSDDNTLGTGPSISKTIIDSSFAETIGNNLAIGETVTYQIELFAPETTISSFVVTDQLPTGAAGTLDFISASLDVANTGIALGAGVPTITAVDTNSDGFEDRITYDFGTVVNPANDGLIGPEDRITVTLVALVVDLPGAVSGNAITNAAQVDAIFNGVTLDPQTDTAPAVIVEPDLDITKTTPVVEADAGDQIPYTITVTHSGDSTGPAYDVVLEDLLADTGIDLDGNVAVTLTIDNIDQSAFIVTGNTPGDTTVRAEIPVLDAGQTAVLTFTGIVTNAVLLGNTVDNSVTLDYDSNPSDVPADGRIYDQETAEESFDTPVPDFEKSVLETSFPETGSGQFSTANPDAGIGEIVTYRFNVTLPEGTAPLVITDQLPIDGVFALEGVIVTPGADMTGAQLLNPVTTFTDSNADGNNDLLVIDLGTVTNSGINGGVAGADSLFVDALIRIVDDPANNAGDVFTNFAELDFGTGTANDFAQIDVVEPVLEIAKSTPVTLADAGDTIPYQISVNHGFTSSAPAYDVVIEDLLADTGLALAGNTAVLTIAGVDQSVFIVTGNGAGDTTVRAEVPVLLVGQTAILTFNAVVTDEVEFAGSFENEVTLDYDSNPSDDPADGRIYDQETSDTSVATPGPAFTKAVLETSNPDTGDSELTPGVEDVALGEVVTYRFAATLPEGSAPLSISDQLPFEGRYEIEGVTVTPGAGVSGANLAAPATTFTDSNGDGRDDLVQINLGVVTNTGTDNAAAGAGILFVDVEVRILEAPAIAEGSTLTNVATLDFGTGTISDDAVIEIVEPDVSLEKSVDIVDPFLGDTVTYTVVVTNDADATSNAYNLVVSDPIPDGLIFQPGSVTASGDRLAVVNSGSNALSVSIAVLAPGETVTITYQAQVSFLAPPLTSIVNVATVLGNSDPSGEGRDLGPVDGQDNPNDDDPTVDDAAIFTQFVSGGSAFEDRMGQIDDEDFRPVLSIDPIFSGAAEPGSQVVITLVGRDGQVMGTQSMVAGVGGQWLIRFPVVNLFEMEQPFDEWYSQGRIFDDSTGIFGSMGDRVLPMDEGIRLAPVGTDLTDDSYTARMAVSGGSAQLETIGSFNARTYFAPANTGQLQVAEDVFEIDDIFQNQPEFTLDALLEQARNPLGGGMNRFNYEFLAASGSVSN